MEEAVQFLLRHGYVVLFAFVSAEQLGLPVPSSPVLLAMGSLAASGRYSFAGALVLAWLASVIGDLIWYELGRRRGRAVLRLMCRISHEPESCVRYAEAAFARHGAATLLFAKFVPGLSAAAVPLAGMMRMPLARFVAWTSGGALLWAGTFTGAGYLFHAQVERVAVLAWSLGASATVAILGGAAGLVAWRLLARRRLLRQRARTAAGIES